MRIAYIGKTGIHTVNTKWTVGDGFREVSDEDGKYLLKTFPLIFEAEPTPVKRVPKSKPAKQE